MVFVLLSQVFKIQKPYTVFGYRASKSNNIHAADLALCFGEVYKNPGSGEVFNIGGGRKSNCSMQEAIKICEELIGCKMNAQYDNRNRIGDHMWYISDYSKFEEQYHAWTPAHDTLSIIEEVFDALD